MNNIFSENQDINKNAYLNWRTSQNHILNMIVLGDGFMSSALLTTEEILKSNFGSRADGLIYPILFNVNHGIEVYLKAISWSLNILNKTVDKFRQNHNLKELLEDVKSLFYSYEKDIKNLKQFDNMIEPLDKYINELYSKIENEQTNGRVQYSIDFSRYSLTSRGEPQFYINELGNVIIDMENFFKVFTNIHKSLDRFSEWLFEHTID